MKNKYKSAFMDTAFRFAKLSTAKRLKVGAIVVKDNRIISIGYNGTPSGWDNDCELYVYPTTDQLNTLDSKTLASMFPLRDDHGEPYRLMTKPEVLHAEANAVSKLARSAESAEGATIFVTHSPCIDCAKLIYQAGIAEVYYHTEYDGTKSGGVQFLEKCNIHIEQYTC